MVSVDDSSSGIRTKGHECNFRMVRICADVGKEIIGLNGSAFCPVAESYVGLSHVPISVTLVGSSHNGDSWALCLYVLNELIAYF